MMTYHVQFLLLVLAGWVNRQQQDVIDYQQEENRVLRAGLRGKRLRLADDERRRLAGACAVLLLVMCTHPFAKKAFTLHLSRSEGHERYFGCNLMHRKALASSHQHLMAEAPSCSQRLDGRRIVREASRTTPRGNKTPLICFRRHESRF